MTLIELLRYNRPSAKPELWAHLLRSLPRHANYRWQRVFSPKTLRDTREIGYDDSLRLRVQIDDVIGRSIYLYGVYEHAVTRLFDILIKPGMRVMDIGSNLGYYALLAAKRAGPQGRVMAFEPVPDLYEELCRNIAINSMSDVIDAEKAAVCEADKTVSIYVHFEIDNRGLSSLEPREKNDPSVSVAGVCLDTVVSRMPGAGVDVLKVDVEGCEDRVFMGGKTVLSRPGAPDIVFESHDPSQTMPILEEYGYTIYDIAYRSERGVVLSPYGRYPIAAQHRFYDPPNYFATKTLRDDLRRLLV
jgi:FkbM family methyltransferase